MDCISRNFTWNLVSNSTFFIIILCCIRMIQSQETMGTMVGPLQLNKAWKTIGYRMPNARFAQRLIRAGRLVAGNAIPRDMQADSANSRLFVVTVTNRGGNPASLGYVPLNVTNPLIIPYPNWQSHAFPVQSCRLTMVSVFGINMDYGANTLFAVDSGIGFTNTSQRRICPPKVLLFNTTQNRLIRSVNIPNNVLKQESVPSALQVENLSNGSRFIYIVDTNGFGLIVADFTPGREARWSRWSSQWFYPVPGLGILNITGTTFQMMRGLYSIALDRRGNETRLYTSTFSSVKLGRILTTILWQNSEGGDLDRRVEIPIAGERRSPCGPIAIDESGSRLFFGDMTGTSLLCWNTNRVPISQQTSRLLVTNPTSLQYFSSLKMENNNTLWVLTTKYQRYATETLNTSDTNFRVFTLNLTNIVC